MKCRLNVFIRVCFESFFSTEIIIVILKKKKDYIFRFITVLIFTLNRRFVSAMFLIISCKRF